MGICMCVSSTFQIWAVYSCQLYVNKATKNNKQYKEVILGSLCVGNFFLKKLYFEEYLGGSNEIKFYLHS